MSDVIDLSLKDLQRENERLKRELKAAILTVEKLMKSDSQKQQEIEHLKELLSQSVPVIQENKTPSRKIQEVVSPEESIAEMQLERLRVTASQRSLTLEETRMYDLLVKNKRLSQDESTINLSKNQYRDISEQDIKMLVAQAEATNEPISE